MYIGVFSSPHWCYFYFPPFCEVYRLLHYLHIMQSVNKTASKAAINKIYSVKWPHNKDRFWSSLAVKLSQAHGVHTGELLANTTTVCLGTFTVKSNSRFTYLLCFLHQLKVIMGVIMALAIILALRKFPGINMDDPS